MEVYAQLLRLVEFIATGFVIGLIFDIFRILRKSFKTHDIITYLQDVIFWIISGFIILFSIFKFNYGEIRAYIFLGIAFGFLLYMITISKFAVKYSVFIITWIKKIISYPIHIILKILNTLIVKPTNVIVQRIKQIKFYKKSKTFFLKSTNKNTNVE